MITKEVLPIGSIVYLKRTLKKVMVVGRLILVPDEETGKETLFDYSGCAYPEGIINQEVLAFNKEEITDVKHMGYRDDEELELIKRLLSWQKEEYGEEIIEEETGLEL